MPGFTDAVEASILNHFFGKSTWTPPSTLYLLVSSTTITDAGSGATEPSGGGYLRVATTGDDWGSPSGTAPVVISNSDQLEFPEATGNWLSSANLTHFGLATASSGGSIVATGALTVAKPVLLGDTLYFPVGSLVLKIGDPSDAF